MHRRGADGIEDGYSSSGAAPTKGNLLIDMIAVTQKHSIELEEPTDNLINQSGHLL